MSSLNKATQPGHLGVGNRRNLRTMAEEYPAVMRCIFEWGHWTGRRLPVEPQESRVINNRLTALGAAEAGCEFQECDDRNYRFTYRLTESGRETLSQYFQNDGRLPCGHRPHVHWHDGHLSCKYCDDDPEYSRGLVQDRLAEWEGRHE